MLTMIHVEKVNFEHQRGVVFINDGITMKRLLVILACTLCASTIKAQSLTARSTRDSLYYYYSLDARQLELIRKNGSVPDTSFLFTNFVKSHPKPFAQIIDTMAYGSYIQSSISENKISYQLCVRFPFSIAVKKLDSSILLYVHDTRQLSKPIISNAVILYYGMPATYDEGFGAYRIPIVRLKEGEKLRALQINFEDKDYTYTIYKQNERAYRGTTHRSPDKHIYGYFISDKPKYKPLDTVRLKAYLLQSNGNAIKEQCNLYLTDATNNKRIWKRAIKPVTKGDFVYEFVLPDTLKTDRNYILTIGPKDTYGSNLKELQFKLEDYVLNKITISASMEKSTLYCGDTAVLVVKTTDANGFPLQDVRCTYTLSIAAVSGLYKDTLLLTSTQQAEWLKVDSLLPYNNEHRFRIFPKDLPPVSAQYTLRVLLIDPQFEQKDFVLNFSINNSPRTTRLYQKRDSLYVKHSFKGRDTSANYVIKIYDGTYKLCDSIPISTPFSLKLKQEYVNVRLFIRDSFLTQINTSYNAITILNTKGERNAKGCTIEFDYPFAEKVHYRVYKNNKVVLSGADTKLRFSLLDTSLDTYKILLCSNINGAIETNAHWVYFYPLSKKLNVLAQIPSTAFPGETVDLAFTVTDYFGKPAKNINMAAYAINAMFEDAIQEPYLDVPTKYKTATEIVPDNTLYSKLIFTPLASSGVHFIKKHHVVQYNLYKNDYYKLVYPQEGLGTVQISKQQNTPELAVMIVKDGNIFTPKYLKVDGSLMFIANLANPHAYSFLLEPGKHQIEVRAFDKLLRINDIMLYSKTKTCVSINLDTVFAKATTKIAIVKDSMNRLLPSADEMQEIERSTLLLSNIAVDSVLTVLNTSNSQKQYCIRGNSLNSITVQDDAYNILLPYNLHTVNLYHARNRHSLSTGRHYYYYDYNSRQFLQKSLSASAPYIFNFTEVALGIYDYTYLVEADTSIPLVLPQYIPITSVSTTPARLFNLDNFTYNFTQSYDSMCYVKLYSDINNTPSHVWIVNKVTPRRSVYTRNYGAQQYMTRSAGQAVDIYLFYANNSMSILRNVRMPHTATLMICCDSLRKELTEENKLIEALEQYNILTATPMAPFYNAPFEGNILELKPTHINNVGDAAYLKGNIISSQLSPVGQADIFFEKNGRYVTGATTNSKGEFECLNLKPGIYDVKVFHSAYQYKFYYNISIGGDKGQITTILLDPRSHKVPKYEAINNSFLYAAYNTAKPDGMRISVYDERTRQVLVANKITFVASDFTETSIRPTGTTITIDAKQVNNTVKIIIECNKHNTMIFQGLLNSGNYQQQLSIFMSDSNGVVDNFNLTLQQPYYRYGYKEVALEEDDANRQYDVYNSAPVAKAMAPAGSAKQIERLASSAAADAVSLRAGTYQAKDGSGISLGGGRASGTAYLVDGVEVGKKKSLGEVKLAAHAEGTDGEEGTEPYAWTTAADKEDGRADGTFQMDSTDVMFEKLMNGANANQYRTAFSDNAYWQSNFFTDKAGKAYCRVKLPDNITTWKAYTIAMGEKFYYGVQSQTIKVYKPMQTIAYLPEFLHKGDSMRCTAKYNNLTPEAKRVVLFAEINKVNVRNTETVIDKTATDSVLVVAKDLTDISLALGLRYQDKYTDAEQKKILVMDNALMHYKYQALMLDKDSIYILSFGDRAQGTITFNNNLYERILQYTKELESYNYGCVEQTSSKLKAMVYQQEINAKLGRKIVRDTEIVKLIRHLQDMQNGDGSFGWWRKGSTDIHMTAYALEALVVAQSKGYACDGVVFAEDYLNKHLNNCSQSERLYCLHLLSTKRAHRLVAKDLDFVNIMSLSTTDKMYYYKLKMLLGEAISDNDIYALCLEIGNRVRWCGYETFFEDERATMFKAFQIFNGTAVQKQIEQMFKQRILSGSLENNLNTFSKATLIEALIAQTTQDGTSISAEVRINDSIKINSYPYTLAIPSAGVTLKHTGAAVFMQSAEEYPVYKPASVDSIFKVGTSFMQNGLNTNTLTRGQKTTMRIALSAYKTKSYVIITIPLPAGVRVKDKKQVVLSGEDYIEYHKDKIVIFKTKLVTGDSYIDIPLQVEYAGSFQMPAAQIYMMYYPFVNGNNEDKTVLIR
jgi:hypothetical protein